MPSYKVQNVTLRRLPRPRYEANRTGDSRRSQPV